MTRIDAARMLRRRLAKAAVVGKYSPHSFRATWLTRFLEEGGTLEQRKILLITQTVERPGYLIVGSRSCSERMWKGFVSSFNCSHVRTIRLSTTPDRLSEAPLEPTLA